MDEGNLIWQNYQIFLREKFADNLTLEILLAGKYQKLHVAQIWRAICSAPDLGIQYGYAESENLTGKLLRADSNYRIQVRSQYRRNNSGKQPDHYRYT